MMAASNQGPQPPLDASLAFRDQEARFARAFTLMREAIHNRAFPAAALAVTHRRKVIALQSFGRFTYEADSPPVEADTVFDLASVTKVVATTAMAMLLYERGLLNLGAPVSDSLWEFLSDATSARKSERLTVTTRMLLAHSSGLPAYLKLFKSARTREQLFQAVYDTPLAAPPGTKTDYSDIGFILLGRILELLAREELDVFCQREIFAPLNMQQTMFNPPLDQRATIPPTEDDRTFRLRIIEGEVNDENAYVMGGVSGHAGLFAPAIDVARFAECMLHGGTPIFQPATVELFTLREASPAGTSRALGWDTPSAPSSSGKYFSPRSFGHLGYTGTSLWIDPERQLSVTLLTNRTWPDRSSQQIKVVRPLIHDAIVEAL
jgi:CubicO group peptidase (beta-lactamase class C family)